MNKEKKKDDSRGVSWVGENMRLQAISMPRANANAYITKNSSKNITNKGGNTYVPVPANKNGETFLTWAAKSVLTASLFSFVLDLGTNVYAKHSKTVDNIPFKEMPKNALKATGIFLLIGAIFQGVSNLVDKKLK